MAVAGGAATAAEPIARLRDVFKIYREGSTETVALRGTDLELPRGQMTSLVGPSGSGKSTMLSLLAGLSLPSAGQVIFEGTDISRLDETARARLRAERMGLVFQSGNLIPFLNALENVQLAQRIAGKPGDASRARDLLSEVGLAQRLNHLPRQLSGGEAQRVSIAVALANDPDLLLADELTGELDSATAAKVMDVLRGAWERRHLTILLVTHNRELAAQAEHRLTLLDGTVRAA
ncbi:MAG TPA: ABC transporter ATP-binding protein [Candidatus Dormibacteraeota bacterium]|nr:ABC transporter ATP-binding protein [Candidatus Dormibacteraeota bacterium]